MLRRALLLVIASSGWWPAVAGDPPADRRPTPEQVRERFYGVWVEAERTAGGRRTTDPAGLTGYLLGPDRWCSWDRRGELSASWADRGVRVDPAADPMRFDLLDGTDGIKPGIFKFDGDELVIALAADWKRERKPGAGEDYPARPKEFRSTKDNGVAVSVLRRGKGMYDID
jgi:uncharacterized protein (TIGR03067 family)